MRKNRWLLFGLFLACTIGVALTMLPPRPGVTKENFDRIQDGMTQADVEAILGGPPSWQRASWRLQWTNEADCCTATIDFDEHGRVVNTGWHVWDDRGFIHKKVDGVLGRKPKLNYAPREGDR